MVSTPTQRRLATDSILSPTTAQPKEALSHPSNTGRPSRLWTICKAVSSWCILLSSFFALASHTPLLLLGQLLPLESHGDLHPGSAAKVSGFHPRSFPPLDEPAGQAIAGRIACSRRRELVILILPADRVRSQAVYIGLLGCRPPTCSDPVPAPSENTSKPCLQAILTAHYDQHDGERADIL
jgi:hypothetical protein